MRPGRLSARVCSLLDAGLFFAGAVLCLVFLQSVSSAIVVAVAAALVSAVRYGARAKASPNRALRALGWLAVAFNVSFHGFVLYLAIAWGWCLAWAVPSWLRAMAVVLALAAIATIRRPVVRP